MTALKYILGPMRLPFLILTPACVILGLSTAIWTSEKVYHVNYYLFVLALIGAFAAHISVNAFNEYFDYKTGLDYKTERTPFSGGSGALPERPEFAQHALITAVVTFLVTAFIGLFFLFTIGPGLLPLGLLGLIIIIAYTPWLTRNTILCLFAPGTGFGLLMVMGTDFVLTGKYSMTSFFASLVPFFLVSNLLLLNQFPDVEADKSIGRSHFPGISGRRKSSFIYTSFILLTYLSIICGVELQYLPELCLIGLVTLIPALFVCSGAYRHADDIQKLIPFMGINVIITVVTPLLLAMGLFLG